MQIHSSLALRSSTLSSAIIGMYRERQIAAFFAAGVGVSNWPLKVLKGTIRKVNSTGTTLLEIFVIISSCTLNMFLLYIAFGTYSHLVAAAVASDWPVGHSFLCKVRHLLNVSRACALTHNTHLLPRGGGGGYSGHFGGGTEIWIHSDLYLSLETLPLRIRWFWGRSVTWMKQELDIVQSIWLILYGHFLLWKSFWLLYDISDGKTTVVLSSPSSIQILHCSTPLFTRLACQTTDRRQSWLLSSFTVLHGHGPLNIQKWRHERQRTTGERERGSCLPLPFKTLGKKEDCQGASLDYVWQIFELCNPLNPCP